MPRVPGSDLPDRHRRLLAALVREHIEHGGAVSSRWLAAKGGFSVSSATVRNILAELEGLGYVRQPHTSAGRVPTDFGYRAYVDLLLEAYRPPRPALEVEARLRRAGTVDDMLADASDQLSRQSHHIGFALAPENEDARVRHIDLVSVGASRVLVVVVADSGQISHKAVDLGEPVQTEELWQAANYLNTEFAGLPLAQVRSAVMQRMREERMLYDALLARALRLISSSLEGDAPERPLFIKGVSSLLDVADVEDKLPVATLRTLVGMMEEKHRLVRLLNEYIDGPGLTVIIGAEHTAPDLRRFSLVASTYSDGESTGTVGIIGPTRMRYSRAIAAVDSLSRMVSRVLLGEHN